MKKSAKRSGLVFILFISLVTASDISVAQKKPVVSDTMKTYTMREVIISATKDLRDPDSVGRSISIIDKKTLDKAMFNNVGDLLVTQPGIFIVGNTLIPGSQQSVFIRGSNANQSVVMIDGVRISDPSTVDNAIDLSELTAIDASRIEIVRGAHSTLYGPSAIGGVINLISDKNIPGTFELNLNSTFGIFNKTAISLTDNLKLSYHRKNGLYFNTGLFQTSVRGFNATLDTITNPKVYNHPDNDNSFKTSYYFKTGFINRKIDAYIMYKRTDQETSLDKGAFMDDDNHYLNFYRNLFTWGATGRLMSDLSLVWSGGFSDTRRVDMDDSSVTGFKKDTPLYDHSFSKTTLTGSYLVNDIYLNYITKYFRVIAGSGFNFEQMNNQNFTYSNIPPFPVYQSETNLDSLNLHASISSFYIQPEINGGLISNKLSGLTLDLGFRYSEHNRFGKNLTYDINPSYKYRSIIFFTCYSTGFNPPSLYQLYIPDKAPGSIRSRGNDKLKPETSRNFEAGIRYFPSPQLRLTLSWFYTKTANLIQYVYLWDKNIPIDSLGSNWKRNDFRGDTYINLSGQEINGIELSIDSRLSEKLDLFANISLVNGKTVYSSKDLDTSQTGGSHVQFFESGFFADNRDNQVIGLSRRPGSLAYISLVYRFFKNMSLKLDNQFVGSRSDAFFNLHIKPYGATDQMILQGYMLSDLTLNWKFLPNLDLSLKCSNIFNKDYVEINGYATMKRGFFIRLKYNFSRS